MHHGEMQQLQDRSAAVDPTTPLHSLAGIDLRLLSTGDVEAVVACSTGHVAQKRPFIVESIGRRTVLGAFSADVLAGYIIWDRAFFARPFAWLLGVAPAFRRRAIASRLLTAFTDECPGEAAFTSTNESNTAMHAVLRGCGFIPSGRVENLDPGDPEIFFYKAPANA